MRETKKKVLRIFLMIEIMVFAGFYLFGTNGLRAISQAENHNKRLAQELATMQNYIEQLNEELEERQTTTFYKEKIARQELQMARENEEIYFL